MLGSALVTPIAGAAPVHTNTAKGPGQVQALLETVVDSLEKDDVAKLYQVSSGTLKAAFTPELFNKLSVQMKSAMSEGTTKTYLGSLKRGLNRTHLWRMEITKAGAYDLLLELTVADHGKVVGFYVR